MITVRKPIATDGRGYATTREQPMADFKARWVSAWCVETTITRLDWSPGRCSLQDVTSADDSHRFRVNAMSTKTCRMPRDGAIIFGDLIGKLDVLYVHCEKCTRAGRYRLDHLIEERGRNAKLIDWLDEITADCPKKLAHNKNDPCGARCPDLPRVL
jgi:hypothetical protein